MDYSLFAQEKGFAPPEHPTSEWVLDTGADDEATPEPDTGGTADDAPTANASFNVVIQYTNFGDTLARCQVEVAFYEPEEDDGTGGGSGEVIAVPDEAGTCAYTAFDPDAEEDPGSMNVRGTLDAGDALSLDDGDPVALPASEGTDGSVTYALADCARETYPFGRTFDLVGEGSIVPAFTLVEAVAVGPDLGRTLPADDDIVAGRTTQSLAEPMSWGWERLHDVPVTSEGPVVPSEVFVIRHARVADDRLVEALACVPGDETGVTISAEDLGQLSPTSEETYAYGQIDAYWDGLEVEAPWGELVKVRSLVSWSGEVELVGG